MIEPGASWEFTLPETKHDAGLVVEYSKVELGLAKPFTFHDVEQSKLLIPFNTTDETNIGDYNIKL